MTTIFAALAAVVACLILTLMAYRVFAPPTAAQKAPPPAAAQAQEIDLSLAQSPSVATPAEAAPVQSSAQGQSPATKSNPSPSAAAVVVPAASKKNLHAPAPAPAGGGLAIYDEHGKLIYGSPIHSDDDAAASKPKKSATPAKNSSTAAPVSSVKPAAAGNKTAAAEAPAPDSNPGLIEGRYVRLKPDLAESLLDDRVEPDYPDAARRARIQGSVILETLIGANGKVQEVIPVSGPPQLAEAAATAVRQWKYKPFTVDGQKVPIRTQVTVTFMLAQ